MIALGPIFQAVGAVVDLIIEAVENFLGQLRRGEKSERRKSHSRCADYYRSAGRSSSTMTKYPTRSTFSDSVNPQQKPVRKGLAAINGNVRKA